MDPISAAGIGLSVASLALQAFAGCVKGYQLFAEAQGMPARYHHLRIRLRIEQARLLNWGEKVGLEEKRLKTPSRTLQQNGNLIIEVMMEMQATFRESAHIEKEYDPYLPSSARGNGAGEGDSDKRDPGGARSMLEKTLRFLEKVPSTKSLKWAMVKKDKFEGLIEKLIGYNTYIEGLLDNSAMEQLVFMQQQTYMAMLQLNSDVAELKELSHAMQIKTSPSTPGNGSTTSSHRSSDTSERDGNRASFARLAEFKAQQISLDAGPPYIEPINSMEVDIEEFDDDSRSGGVYQEQHVWIEWKHYDIANNADSGWNALIEDRIKKLAILLGSDHKPEQFGAPHCLGYFNDTAEARYGFLYKKPIDVPALTKAVSLFDLLNPENLPSLSKRITLAHAIARCLMYLHSVNWLHKGLRSNNIIFFAADGTMPEYHEPIIAGFEYARPDLPGEETDRPPQPSKDDIYRHPAVLRGSGGPRSQKSHDIYSLGIVLIEIAYWQRIHEIVGLPQDPKKLASNVRKVRDSLLASDSLRDIENHVGELYGSVVRRCLAGGVELGIPEGAKETDAEVGACMQSVFAEEIVNKLGDIRI